MRLLDRLKALREPEGPAPMLLSYTPGKVGGTAVVEAMRQAGLEAHQVHILRPDVLTNRAQASFALGELPLRHISTAMALRRDLVSGNRDVRIFTGVRDPLEQSLSAFFENLHRRTDGLDLHSAPEDLFDAWVAMTGSIWAMGWLNFEMKDQLGIDVLAHPFDKTGRMARLAAHKTLVLRVDCPPDRKETALSEFVGRPIKLGRANVGDAKPYALAYRAVQERAKVPAALVDEIYGSAYVRHFWLDEERAALAARWSGM